MREQIEHMQQLQLAGTLSSGIAHDLNDQLTLVLGSLEMALHRLPASYDAYDSLELAKTAAGRCADMSRRLLHLSRLPRPVMERVDIAGVIREAHDMLECVKPPNTQITTDAEPGLSILGSPIQLQQLLINLGTNAFHAMPHGGSFQISAHREGGRVRLTARDTGCGIPKSLTRRVFVPFYTTRGESGGSGLDSRMFPPSWPAMPETSNSKARPEKATSS